MTTVLLMAIAAHAQAQSPLEAEAALLPAATLDGIAAIPAASPTSGYPVAFSRPSEPESGSTPPGPHRAPQRADTSTAAAAAAFAEQLPTRDADSLAERLKAMEEMVTLWDNDDAKIFVGLDDAGHPGIHIRNKERR